MKTMLFAAGMGTRLKPLTDTLPKALVPLCGQPLLWHVVRRLQSFGIQDFVINIHHFAGKIRTYIETNPLPGAHFYISDESDLLRDTGGGIRHAESLLNDEAFFMVHNVDIISNLDPCRLEEAVRASSPLATVVVSGRETSRYLLFDEDMNLVGWTNVKTGEIRTPYPHLDPSGCRRLAFSGIHAISRDIFNAFREIDAAPDKFPLYDWHGNVIEGSQKPLGEVFSIIDFYLRICASHPIKGYVPDNYEMTDVGKPDSLAEAEKKLSEM